MSKEFKVGDVLKLHKDSLFIELFNIDNVDNMFFVLFDSYSPEGHDDTIVFVMKATDAVGKEITDIGNGWGPLAIESHFEITPVTEEEKQKVLSMSLLVSEVDFE